MKIKSRTKRILALALVILVSLTLFADYANAATSSNGRNTQVITVETKSNYWVPGSESITLSQKKGVIEYTNYNLCGTATGTSTVSKYGTWRINVKSTDGSHSYSSKLSGGSVKLKLKPNKTYKITVSWDYNIETIILLDQPNSKWKSLPSWRVSGTYKVSNYY